MITEERYRIILEELDKSGIVKVKDIMDLTDSSESTIRRDLNTLEKKGKLIRIHGGATMGGKFEEAMDKKSLQHVNEKELIARNAASLVRNGECIFLDAGSTTFRMIKHLEGKDIIVVTNGISHLDELARYGIRAYLTGGMIKFTTKALVGKDVVRFLKEYNFDRCFLGVNSVDLKKGFTTPDPDEAYVKETAKEVSRKVYVLADSTKFDKITFAKFAEISECTIITDKVNQVYADATEVIIAVK
jgi:DeoR family fructose operon transcriptional repressor